MLIYIYIFELNTQNRRRSLHGRYDSSKLVFFRRVDVRKTIHHQVNHWLYLSDWIFFICVRGQIEVAQDVHEPAMIKHKYPICIDINK